MARAEQQAVARLLRSCDHPRHLPEGKRIHSRMAASEEQSSSRTLCNLVVEMYGRCGDLESARRAFAAIREPNTCSWNILMEAYTSTGRLRAATGVFFNEIAQRDVVSWNSLISVYGRRGRSVKAREALERMPKHNSVSWNAAMQAAGIDEAKRLFDQMPHRSLVSWVCMAYAYARLGSIAEAKLVFDRTPAWDLPSWNAMLSVNAHVGDTDAARSVLAEMPVRDETSWKTFAGAFLRQGTLAEARAVAEGDLQGCNAVLAAFTLKGHLQEAREVFEQMDKQRDGASWLTMIKGLVIHGRLGEAKRLLDQMPRLPD